MRASASTHGMDDLPTVRDPTVFGSKSRSAHLPPFAVSAYSPASSLA